jgi:hypothetical protein
LQIGNFQFAIRNELRGVVRTRARPAKAGTPNLLDLNIIFFEGLKGLDEIDNKAGGDAAVDGAM